MYLHCGGLHKILGALGGLCLCQVSQSKYGIQRNPVRKKYDTTHSSAHSLKLCVSLCVYVCVCVCADSFSSALL